MPHVRLSVHGPKTDSSNAFTPCARPLILGHSISPHCKKRWEDKARLFRPMYALRKVIVQKLPAERFGLQYHEENRKQAAYVLIVSKDGT